MNLKKITTGALALAVLVGGTTGCSKRRIDPESTGSVRIEGTTWQRFCDGPNAVIWVEGSTDELEAYVYDHHECVEEFYGEQVPTDGTDRPADDDGISKED